MNNKKGFSLVEVLVVIAILAVLGGASLTGLSRIRYANTKKCTDLISRTLDEVRVETLSMEQKPYLYIYNYNGEYYIKTSTIGTYSVGSGLDGGSKKIANGDIMISYQTIPAVGSAPSPSAITMGNYIRISYKKSTGAFEGAAEIHGGSCMVAAPDNCNLHCDSILIDGSSAHTIKLVKSTGKHTVD